MSFDVFLCHFVNGNVSAADPGPVRDVLESRRYVDSGDDWYPVEFDDGTTVEFLATGMRHSRKAFEGCSFFIRAFGPEVAQFMFEVARAGDFVMIPAMEEPVVILVDRRQENDLLVDDMTGFRLVPCTDAADVATLLHGGHRDWAQFRDSRLGGPNEAV